ncbi:taste receptor type 2 member 40-like [Scleropages formosus]|nr:taste receptor type 2 member 40-like [Scleropages formosus]
MESIGLNCTMAAVCIGFLWNGVNLVATVLHQLRTGGRHTAGLIISCISVSNMLLELSTAGIVAAVWAGMFCLQEVHLLLKAMLFFWFISSYMSFWSIAWLSVFYCVKVVSASSPLIKMLKKNISSIIDLALVLTVGISALILTPFFFLTRENPTNVTMGTNKTENATCVILTPSLPAWINSQIYTSVVIGFLCPIPLAIMLTTSLRLVMYLCKHTMSMRKNKTEIQSTDSYLLVCKLTISLVAVYLTTLATIGIFLVARMAKVDMGNSTLELSFSIYCIATAVLLTASNKYLKEKIWALLCSRRAARPGASTQSESTAFY